MGILGSQRFPLRGRAGGNATPQRLHFRYVLSNSVPTTRTGSGSAGGERGHKSKEEKEMEKDEAEALAAGPAPERGPSGSREPPTP